LYKLFLYFFTDQILDKQEVWGRAPPGEEPWRKGNVTQCAGRDSR